MTSKLTQRKLKELEAICALEQKTANRDRARSFMIGTSFGGVTELSMRTDDGRNIWAPLQPVEVTELIHQLAANVGCHIQLTPRNDFASWRNWRITEHQHKHLQGHPAFPNDMEPHMKVGTDKFSIEDQRRADSFFPPENLKNEREMELENVVAAQETIDRRTIEQSPTST
jgi:hypothetical protein